MLKKIASLLTILMSTSFLCASSYGSPIYEEPNLATAFTKPIGLMMDISVGEIASAKLTDRVEEIIDIHIQGNDSIYLSDSDVNLIALITMAEAEGESEYGQRLVIDTILNRVDSNQFPNTVSGVVYQKYQFSSVWNGRVDRCCVLESIRNLVIEECRSRTNSDVLYFTAGRYGKYGTPMFREGNHYFSM